MKLLTLLVFAGITGLALAALQEPRKTALALAEQEKPVYGSSAEIRANFAEDWRNSLQSDIRAQIREGMKARTRAAVQNAPYLDSTPREQRLAQASARAISQTSQDTRVRP